MLSGALREASMYPRGILDRDGASSSVAMRMRGRTIRIFADQAESIAFLHDAFYPDGAFGATFADPAHDGVADFVVRDRTLRPDELQAFWAWAGDRGRPGRFELTKNVWRPRLSLDRFDVFSLAGEPSPTNLLVREENVFTILGVPGRERKRWVTRLLRDVGTRLAFAQGSLALHSSAFEVGGRAYLAIGDSGSGKTTLSMAVARLLGRGGWIGNDRIHVDPQRDTYLVSACPLSLAANKGTLEILDLRDYREWDLHNAVPDDSTDWAEYNGEIKLKISPREIERHLGISTVAAAPLGGIVLPRIDFGGSLSLSSVTAAAARPIILRNCLSIADNLYGEDWLGLQDARPDPLALLDRFLAHIDTVPILQCTTSRPSDVAPLVQQLAERLAFRS